MRRSTSWQTIEFPDDELVEPLEGLDIAEDGIELPPPPPPEPDKAILPPKPNLLVSRVKLACVVRRNRSR